MSEPLMERLIVSVSAMLMHSLWQGALIGACLVMAFQFTRRRYVATATALGLIAVCSLATWWLAFSVPADAGLTAGSGSAATEGQIPESAVLPVADSGNVENGVVPETSPMASTSTPSPGAAVFSIEEAVHLTSHWREWVVCLWLLGFAVFVARLCRDWMAVRRLHLTSSGLEPSSQWTGRLRELANRMQVTASVDLRLSPAVASPVTFGVLRPMILLPPAMLANLAPTHLEALLLHELAHIRRHDYFANLLQNTMECVFFFHPVVWWMSSLMRVEREFCCDALAASQCCDTKTYATALTSLETSRCEVPPTIALASIGSGRPELVQRIRRLAGHADHNRFGAATLGGMLVALTLTASAVVAIASVYDSGDSISAEVDWSTLRTTHYEGDQQHILFLHTAEMVQLVLLISPPEGYLSASSSCQVDRMTPRDNYVASAEFRWDDADIRLAFDSRRESIVRINDRAYSLAAGRVFHLKVGDDVPRQSGVLHGDLPDPDETLPDALRQAVSSVRSQALEQLSQSANTVTVIRGHGQWQLSDGVVLEMKYSPLNGPNLQTYGVIHWPRTETEPARYCRFDVSEDEFGNREPWAVAWQEGSSRLWLVTGERQLMGRPDQPAAKELSSIDYQDSHHVRVEKYDGIPSAIGHRDAVLAELSQVMPLTAEGQLTGQVHLTSVPGAASPPGWIYNPLDVVVFLDADNKTSINGDRTEVSVEELRRVRRWRLNDWDKQVARSNAQFQTAVAGTPPVIRAVIMARAGVSETQVERIIEMCTAAALWGTARHADLETVDDEAAPAESEDSAAR